jgi:hypothetical protein
MIREIIAEDPEITCTEIVNTMRVAGERISIGYVHRVRNAMRRAAVARRAKDARMGDTAPDDRLDAAVALLARVANYAHGVGGLRRLRMLTNTLIAIKV